MPSGVWLSGFAAFEITSVSNWNEILASPVAVALGVFCDSRQLALQHFGRAREQSAQRNAFVQKENDIDAEAKECAFAILIEAFHDATTRNDYSTFGRKPLEQAR